MVPKASTVRSTRVWIWSRSVASVGTWRTFAPTASISPAACSRASWPRAASTTEAPASAKPSAMAFPIPLLPPVTMATLPSSENGSTGRSFLDPVRADSIEKDPRGCFRADGVI